MPDRRPFQFGLRAIFRLTVLVAALAWLARGLEPVVAWIVMPYLCLGAVQCVSAYGVWKELPAGDKEPPRRAALGSVLFIFVLTMPAWAAAVVFVLLSGELAVLPWTPLNLANSFSMAFTVYWLAYPD